MDGPKLEGARGLNPKEKYMSESFAELFEESLKTVELKSGSIITGVVLSLIHISEPTRPY